MRTSEIVLTKDVSGKIEDWQRLESELAENIAAEINNPITIKSSRKEKSLALQSILTYSKTIDNLDEGKLDLAIAQIQKMRVTTEIDDQYLIDLEKQIKRVKFNNLPDLVLKSVTQGDFTCDITNLVDIGGAFSLVPTGIDFYDFYKTDQMNVVCNEFNESVYAKSLGIYVKDLNEQELLYQRLIKYIAIVDEIVLSSNEIKCDGGGYKERSIALILRDISKIIGFFDVGENNNKNAEFLFEKSKIII